MPVTYEVKDRRLREDGSMDAIVVYEGGDFERQAKRMVHFPKSPSRVFETQVLDASVLAIEREQAESRNRLNSEAEPQFTFIDTQAHGVWTRVPELILANSRITQSSLETQLEIEFPSSVFDFPAFLDLMFRAAGVADYPAFVQFVVTNAGTIVRQTEVGRVAGQGG